MTPTIDLRYGVDVLEGLAALPAGSVHCVVTSPPYWGLRAYLPAGHADKGAELGAEKVHDCAGWATGHECGECFCCHLVAVFRAVRRVLRDNGTVWLNLGDSYNSNASNQQTGETMKCPSRDGAFASQGRRNKQLATLPAKNLMLIPARVALAAQADGWIVRQDVIWAKTAPMPESVTDRFTKSHEHVFMLAKQGRYFFDAVAVAEPAQEWTGQAATFARNGAVGQHVIPNQGAAEHRPERTDTVTGATRNRRDVLLLGPDPYPKSHFATMPRELARICILAGSSAGGCCAKCQAPYVRQVERGAPVRIGGNAGVSIAHADGPMDRGGNGQWDVGHMPMVRKTTSTGWRASCTCHAGDPVPCTILDPFSGSGTTAAVAKACGRSAIGIDLNAAYLPLAEDRVAGVTAPMVPAGYEDPAPVQTDGNGTGAYEHEQQELFA